MQNHYQIEEKGLLMASSTTKVNDNTPINPKPHQQLRQQSFKCPRCNSSNTKFCYYNNYSLSQPRHFCKACKRYWTHGGTLRNVPVGGGCRKNKRVRRPTTSASTISSSSSLDVGATITNPPSSHMMNNASFHGLPAEINNLAFPSFINPHHHHRHALSSGYDLHPLPQLSGLGLGFSAPTTQISDPLLCSYGMFESSSSSLGASNVHQQQQQQRFVNVMNGLNLRAYQGVQNHHQIVVPFQGNNFNNTNEALQVEEGRDHQMDCQNDGNLRERIGKLEPEPEAYSSLYNWTNKDAIATPGGWSSDVANMGASVTSLF